MSDLEIPGGQVDVPSTVDAVAVAANTWRTLDVTTYTSVTNPNGMTWSVEQPSATVSRLRLTGDGLIRDGISEAVGLYWPITDASGAAVDITQRKHLLRARVTIVAATANKSMLVMFGIKTRPSSPSTGVIRAAGLSTGTATIEASNATLLGSNSPTGASGLYRIDLDIPPIVAGSGGFDVGQVLVNRFTSAGVRINGAELSPDVDATPATPMWCLLLGSDALSVTAQEIVDVHIQLMVVQVEQ